MPNDDIVILHVRRCVFTILATSVILMPSANGNDQLSANGINEQLNMNPYNNNHQKGIIRQRRSITSDDENAIIEKLNEVRRRVRGASMLYVTWDPQLESFAAMWTKGCDGNFVVHKSAYVNQTLVATYHTRMLTLVEASEFFFNSDPQETFFIPNIEAIGCAEFRCRIFKESNGTYLQRIYLYACLVGFTGWPASLPGEPRAQPCSACPPSHSFCERGLCKRPDQRPEFGFPGGPPRNPPDSYPEGIPGPWGPPMPSPTTHFSSVSRQDNGTEFVNFGPGGRDSLPEDTPPQPCPEWDSYRNCQTTTWKSHGIDEDAKESPGLWQSKSAVGIIVGIVAGIVLIFVLVMVAVLHLVIRAKNRQRRTRTNRTRWNTEVFTVPSSSNNAPSGEATSSTPPPPYEMTNSYPIAPPPYTAVQTSPPYALYTNNRNTTRSEVSLVLPNHTTRQSFQRNASTRQHASDVQQNTRAQIAPDNNSNIRMAGVHGVAQTRNNRTQLRQLHGGPRFSWGESANGHSQGTSQQRFGYASISDIGVMRRQSEGSSTEERRSSSSSGGSVQHQRGSVRAGGRQRNELNAQRNRRSKRLFRGIAFEGNNNNLQRPPPSKMPRVTTNGQAAASSTMPTGANVPARAGNNQATQSPTRHIEGRNRPGGIPRLGSGESGSSGRSGNSDLSMASRRSFALTGRSRVASMDDPSSTGRDNPAFVRDQKR